MGNVNEVLTFSVADPASGGDESVTLRSGPLATSSLYDTSNENARAVGPDRSKGQQAVATHGPVDPVDTADTDDFHAMALPVAVKPHAAAARPGNGSTGDNHTPESQTQANRDSDVEDGHSVHSYSLPETVATTEEDEEEEEKAKGLDEKDDDDDTDAAPRPRPAKIHHKHTGRGRWTHARTKSGRETFSWERYSDEDEEDMAEQESEREKKYRLAREKREEEEKRQGGNTALEIAEEDESDLDEEEEEEEEIEAEVMDADELAAAAEEDRKRAELEEYNRQVLQQQEEEKQRIADEWAQADAEERAEREKAKRMKEAAQKAAKREVDERLLKQRVAERQRIKAEARERARKARGVSTPDTPPSDTKDNTRPAESAPASPVVVTMPPKREAAAPSSSYGPVAIATFKIHGMRLEDLPAGSHARSAFQQLLLEDIRTALDVPKQDLRVLSLQAGSVIVELEIKGGESDSAAKRVATLETMIRDTSSPLYDSSRVLTRALDRSYFARRFVARSSIQEPGTKPPSQPLTLVAPQFDAQSQEPAEPSPVTPSDEEDDYVRIIVKRPPQVQPCPRCKIGMTKKQYDAHKVECKQRFAAAAGDGKRASAFVKKAPNETKPAMPTANVAPGAAAKPAISAANPASSVAKSVPGAAQTSNPVAQSADAPNKRRSPPARSQATPAAAKRMGSTVKSVSAPAINMASKPPSAPIVDALLRMGFPEVIAGRAASAIDARRPTALKDALDWIENHISQQKAMMSARKSQSASSLNTGGGAAVVRRQSTNLQSVSLKAVAVQPGVDSGRGVSGVGTPAPPPASALPPLPGFYKPQ